MSNWIGPYKRLVVCAANRYGGLIIPGARHFDNIMRVLILELVSKGNFGDMIENGYGTAEQGFIDQHGVFMTREEAFIVARDAGQLNVHRTKTPHADSVKLFSEDLY